MLLTKEVEVGLKTQTVSYYESLGYDIPRRKIPGRWDPPSVPRGSKLKVKVEDLPNKSHVRVDVQCPQCSKTYSTEYRMYLKSKTGLCKHCYGLLAGERKKGKPCYALRGRRMGADNPNWKGGTVELNKLIRNSNRYNTWRLKVYERDNFTCKKCGGTKSGSFNCHHINMLSDLIDKYKITKFNINDFDDVLYNIDNGITLCKECHTKFHHDYGRMNNTKEQIEHFLSN